MKSTTKAVITISAVFAALFVPPLFFATEYKEAIGETGMRSFCAIFIAIVAWAVFGKMNELDMEEERRKNNIAEVSRNRSQKFILALMFVGFAVALGVVLFFILSMSGY